MNTRFRHIVLTALAAGLLVGGCVVTERYNPNADAVAPDAPEVLGTTPQSPSSDPNPRVFGRAEPGSVVRVYVNADCAGAPIATGTAAEFAEPGLVVDIPLNAANELRATSTDAAGNVSACSPAGPTYVHDNLPPTFAGASGAVVVSGTQITVSWDAAEDAASPAEKIVYDICVAPAAEGCGSFVVHHTTAPGATMWNLGSLERDTDYVVAVRARDEAGNTNPTAAELDARTSGWAAPESLATGGFHSCALRPDGTAACWGWNIQGQLGSLNYPGLDSGGPGDLLAAVRSPNPVTVEGLTGGVVLSAGWYHTCALRKNGSVSCWGSNGVGQLGIGTAHDFSIEPKAVTGLDAGVGLVAGAGHNCALLRGGKVQCWGAGGIGQLGDGAGEDRTEPVEVADLDQAVAVSAGAWHTCALRANGSVSCWGAGDAGQLGSVSKESRPRPVVVPGIQRAIALAAGAEHACALILGGEVRCWGRGVVAEAVTPTPVAISGLGDVTSITAGQGHTCALRTDGSARCWGAGALGQLGDGMKQAQLTPVAPTGITGAVAVAAGGADDDALPGGHSCALFPDGSARCWGRNDFGQLGDGTIETRSTPVDVSGLVPSGI